MPNMLNSNMPEIDHRMLSHSAKLSPNQCCAYWPVPGNVERENATLRWPVESRAALKKTTHVIFGSVSRWMWSTFASLLTGDGHAPTVQTVNIVEISQLLFRFHAQSFLPHKVSHRLKWDEWFTATRPGRSPKFTEGPSLFFMTYMCTFLLHWKIL